MLPIDKVFPVIFPVKHRSQNYQVSNFFQSVQCVEDILQQDVLGWETVDIFACQRGGSYQTARPQRGD